MPGAKAGVGRRIFAPKPIDYLDRQETGGIRRARFALRLRFRRISRIAQPLEDYVRAHRMAPRHMHHRDTRRRRVSADRPLLLAPPKPLRLTRHQPLRSVRYPERTLPINLYPQQSSQPGRLRLR